MASFYSSGAMDLSKYPLEKLVYFIAGIIPGFVALLIYALTVPGSFGWLITIDFLGYKTKLSLILLVAFVIGNSLTTFLSALLGAIGGEIGRFNAQRPYKPAPSYDQAPWRDRRWRVALKNYLGADAPNNTYLLSGEFLKLKHRHADYLPEPQRLLAHSEVESEKLTTEMDDLNWAYWYDHFHRIVLFDQLKRDFQWHVRQGLIFNLETTGLYLFICAIFVPYLRHWWCILPAFTWVLVLVAQEYSSFKNYVDQWSTLSEQTKYLMAQEPIKEPPNRTQGKDVLP
jgi:hypothetical protein